MKLKILLRRRVGKAILLAEPYIFSIPAFFVYIGLVFVKVIKRKRVVFYELTCSQIGHLAANTELFLRRLKYANYYDKENNIYIGLCNHFPVSNRQLLNMYKRDNYIIESRILKGLFNTWIKKTEFYHIPPMNSNEYYEFNNYTNILNFTEEEKILGKQLLKEMGIGEKDWFVCFHSRDSEYLGSCYHDYRDSDINNYMLAAEYIAEKGGYALRMGAVVDKPLPKERHPKIIDYATEYRSDFMDIYLAAHCKFFLGNTAGIFLVYTVFNIPVACANIVPLEYPPFRTGDLFIPKKMWSRDKKRFLTYKEILDSGAGLYLESKQYENAGIEVVENSSDEILELAREMNMRLDKNYESTDEDEELQRKYISLFKPNNHCYGTQARIGTYFLRKNIELLDLRYAEKEKLFCQPIRNENLIKNHIK